MRLGSVLLAVGSLEIALACAGDVTLQGIESTPARRECPCHRGAVEARGHEGIKKRGWRARVGARAIARARAKPVWSSYSRGQVVRTMRFKSHGSTFALYLY